MEETFKLVAFKNMVFYQEEEETELKLRRLFIVLKQS